MKNNTEQKTFSSFEEIGYQELVVLVEDLAAWVTYWERNIELESGKEWLEVLRMRSGNLISDIRKSHASENDLFTRLIEAYQVKREE